jgi:hypothetical protein
MFSLKPPRHIPTLPNASVGRSARDFRFSLINGHRETDPPCLKGAKKPTLRTDDWRGLHGSPGRTQDGRKCGNSQRFAEHATATETI